MKHVYETLNNEHIVKHFNGGDLYNVDKSVVGQRNIIFDKDRCVITQLSISTTEGNLLDHISTSKVSSTSVISSPRKDLKRVQIKTIST